MTSTEQSILIIGAGISGLTLAQACRKESIPFRIFERDDTSTSRSPGWGLTLNWSLPVFRSLVPEDVLARLPETYVNQKAVNADLKGNFTFYDLSTGEAKWKVPASERIRVGRQRLRKLLLSNLDIEWGKTLSDIAHDAAGVTAFFSDGSQATGSLLVACDGSHSVARRLLHHENAENYKLPVRLIGVGALYVDRQIVDMLKLDPYFLQGADSKTDAFMYFSFLEVPGDPGAPDTNVDGNEQYRCQIVISWPYREGFFDRADPTAVPNTERGMLIWMKSLAANWAEPFRSLVQNISKDSDFKPIELTDWLPLRSSGLDHGGRVALVGDAAHAMVMYRGEGANHAIVDVSVLLDQIRPLYHPGGSRSIASEDLLKALRKYEDEMMERTEVAVLASRQACLDAHDHRRQNDNSPLIRRRLMKADLEGEVRREV